MSRNKLITGLVVVLVIVSFLFYFVLPTLVLNDVNPASTRDKALFLKDVSDAFEISNALRQYKSEETVFPWEKNINVQSPTDFTSEAKISIKKQIISELHAKSYIKPEPTPDEKYNNIFIFFSENKPKVCVKQLDQKNNEYITKTYSSYGSKIELVGNKYLCFVSE